MKTTVPFGPGRSTPISVLPAPFQSPTISVSVARPKVYTVSLGHRRRCRWCPGSIPRCRRGRHEPRPIESLPMPVQSPAPNLSVAKPKVVTSSVLVKTPLPLVSSDPLRRAVQAGLDDADLGLAVAGPVADDGNVRAEPIRVDAVAGVVGVVAVGVERPLERARGVVRTTPTLSVPLPFQSPAKGKSVARP